MSKSRFPQKDEMGAHARLYRVILDSPAWLALEYSAQALYVALRKDLNSHNNGNISATLGTLKQRGFKSSSTLAKGLRELEAVGLIARTRQGDITTGGKLCNLFRFTDQPCYEIPLRGLTAEKATKDWLEYDTLAKARETIKAAHLAALRPETRARAMKAQLLKRTASTSEASARGISSECVH